MQSAIAGLVRYRLLQPVAELPIANTDGISASGLLYATRSAEPISQVTAGNNRQLFFRYWAIDYFCSLPRDKGLNMPADAT